MSVLKSRFLCLIASLVLTSSVFGVTPLLPGYLTDAGAGKEVDLGPYTTPNHLKYPYVSTYYVEPTIKDGCPVRINYYVTDWNHSKARANDDSARFDVTVRYSRDCTNWNERVNRNVKTGDGSFELGVLPRGSWTLSIQARDRKSNLPSGVVWHEFRVVPKDFFVVADRELHCVSEKDLADYGITRLDEDYERIVSIPVDEKLAMRRDSYQKRAEEGLKRVDAYIAAYGHKDLARPGYAVYVPTYNGKPINRAYEIARIVRDKGYDTNAVAKTARRTREGLQKLLDDKRCAGIRKVRLMKGVYRIDSEGVKIPAGLTLDLGGSTVKMNGFTGHHGKVFRIGSGYDTVLENGIVEGDYFEHDYAGSAHKSEGVRGWEIDSAAWYCEVRDVITRNIVGYGGSNYADKDKPGTWLTYSSVDGRMNTIPLYVPDGWTRGGFRLDGLYDADDRARWTSRRVDISGFIPFKYLTVSKLSGYQGIRTRNWNLTIAYFDATGSFLKAELVEQYRVSLLPPGAKYARVSIEVASLEEAQKCDLTIYLLKIPQNGAVRRCSFERCRAIGYSMSACRNWLMEDCDFSYCGETLATCAFDAEDGWDGTQDPTFRRNRFHDNPNNDFLVCGGHNFVYEGNSGAIHFWPSSFSPCVRSNDVTRASFYCRNRNRTGYWRFEGNTYKESLTIGQPGEVYQDWNIVVANCTFSSASTNNRFRVQSSGTGLFRNCIFDGVSASPGSAEGCTFRNCDWNWARYNSGTWRNCTAVDCRIPRLNATNLYDHCVFRNVMFAPSRWSGQFFRDCVLENVRFPPYWDKKDISGVITHCHIKPDCLIPDVLDVLSDCRDDRDKTKKAK